jgi:hypothetical protein
MAWRGGRHPLLSGCHRSASPFLDSPVLHRAGPLVTGKHSLICLPARTTEPACGVHCAGSIRAVYDLLGEATNRPIYQLLGGAVRTTLPVYGSSMSKRRPHKRKPTECSPSQNHMSFKPAGSALQTRWGKAGTHGRGDQEARARRAECPGPPTLYCTPMPTERTALQERFEWVGSWKAWTLGILKNHAPTTNSNQQLKWYESLTSRSP